MGKNKLKKFAEMQEFDCVYQYPFGRLQAEGFPLLGKWKSDVFDNDNPIFLELGCGKGEYTVELARRFPDRNFVGIDVKGARIYTGAKAVHTQGIGNAAFLRTDIELIPHFFAPAEIDELWITFPDPQMKKTRRRLTSTRFLDLYRKICKPGAIVNLKTDSPFLYEYTRRLVELNGLESVACTADLYSEPEGKLPESLTSIRTFYEQQWLARGKKIKYIAFRLPYDDKPLVEPQEDDIEKDDYRAYPRGMVQGNETQKL